jgi:fucose permease
MALVMAGFAHGPFFPLEILLTAERFSADRTTRMVGFEIAAANVGAALLSGLMGVAVGIESLAVIPPILTINACLLWGAIETLRWSTRQRHRGTTMVG